MDTITPSTSATAAAPPATSNKPKAQSVSALQGVGLQPIVLPTSAEDALASAAASLVGSFDTGDVRTLLDSMEFSTQSRALSSAFNSIYNSTGLVSQPLFQGFSNLSNFANLSNLSNSSGFSGLFGSSGNSDALSLSNLTLSYLRPPGLYSANDLNSDGRLGVGELINLAA